MPDMQVCTCGPTASMHTQVAINLAIDSREAVATTVSLLTCSAMHNSSYAIYNMIN